LFWHYNCKDDFFYPEAGLIHNARRSIPIYVIDTNEVYNLPENITIIQKGASEGIKVLLEKYPV
jgi:NAD-dependent deacetylase